MDFVRSTLILVFAFCLVASGCGRVYGPVKEVEAYVSLKDEILLKWQNIAKSNATSAGMAEARKFFNDKKADLIAKKEAIAKAPQGMNVDWQSLLMRNEGNDFPALNAIESEFGALKDGKTYEQTKALQEDFKSLRKEYETAVKR